MVTELLEPGRRAWAARGNTAGRTSEASRAGRNSPYLGDEGAREGRDEPAIDSALEGLLGNHQNALP